MAVSLIVLFSVPVIGQEDSSSPGVVKQHRVKLTDAVRKEIQYYVKLLDSGNPYLDDWARRNLIQLGSTAVSPLLKALDRQPPRKRFLICEILGEIRDARAVPSLINRLEDAEANPSVASAAARALGKIGDQRAIDPLMNVLDTPDRELLYNTIVALGKLRAKKAVDELIKKVDDNRKTFYKLRIGNAALSALGRIRSRKALKKIKSVLTSEKASNVEDPTGLPVSFYAVRALEQIALETKGPVMVGGGKDQKNTRQQTIDAWISWINNELGIKPEKKKRKQNGEKSPENGEAEDGEGTPENKSSSSGSGEDQ